MNVGVFLGVFALIFLLELPDKSMIATIVMSTRARSSSIVIGASAGFVIQMGIAVGAGGLLTLLPIHVKDIIVAILFFGGAGYLLFSHDETAEEKGTREPATGARQPHRNGRPWCAHRGGELSATEPFPRHQQQQLLIACAHLRERVRHAEINLG